MSAQKIGLVDYGCGNLRSVRNALLQNRGVEVAVSHAAAELAACDKIILPGVGAFASGMANLRQRNLPEILAEEVLERGKPLLGICLGMQLMLQKSYEHGETPGLGWVEGRVLAMRDSTAGRLPHMGWNDTRARQGNLLLAGVEDGSDFYYVHSFHVSCRHDQDVSATCEYGFEFHAMLQRENLFGAQFHPEKSQRQGLKLIENFVRL